MKSKIIKKNPQITPNLAKISQVNLSRWVVEVYNVSLQTYCYLQMSEFLHPFISPKAAKSNPCFSAVRFPYWGSEPLTLPQSVVSRLKETNAKLTSTLLGSPVCDEHVYQRHFPAKATGVWKGGLRSISAVVTCAKQPSTMDFLPFQNDLALW